MRKSELITLAHGGGGALSAELTQKIFLPEFSNPYLESLSDGAILSVSEKRLAFSTDSFVIDPLFFPGGDIGSLAVHGTVNDLAVCGSEPRFLSAGFILEEGLPIADLKKIVHSMGEAARECNVSIVTGDTKVVSRGSADKVFINTSGIGFIKDGIDISASRVKEGDKIILSGTIGDHGMAVLTRRKGLEFESEIRSDSQPLHDLVRAMLEVEKDIHMMRDATRGGLSAVLNEIAHSAGVKIVIEENAVLVNDNVRSVCEILGLDVLHVANEGKLVAFVPSETAEKVLDIMKKHPKGKDSSIIGTVTESGSARVEMKTSFIGSRIIEPLVGDQLPRIC